MGTRRNLGRPLPLTDEDLDELSDITEADLLQAAAKWEELASPKFKNLLWADGVEESLE